MSDMAGDAIAGMTPELEEAGASCKMPDAIQGRERSIE